MRKFVTLGISALVGLASAAPVPVKADGIADFYRDKRIRVIAAAGAGGGFGLRARLLAEFLGRHLPGKPAITAEFMPGAGGRRAADYIYTVAPKNGTAFGVLFNNTALVSILQPQGTHYDPLKFTWLGSQSPAIIALYVWHTAPATTIEGLRKRPVVFGTLAKGAVGYMLATAMNSLAGTKFKIVTGYNGTADYLKAIEAGEIQSALADWDSIVSVRGNWVKQKMIVPVVQFGLEKHPQLPNVPRLVDLTHNANDRKVAELEGLAEAMGHTNAAPPDVPAERAAALRKAIADTYKDPDFIRASEKVAMAVAPVSAADVEKYVREIVSQPADLIARARVVYGMN